MSFLTAQPEELAAAAGKLHAVGAQQVAQNAAAAIPTTAGVIPAAADEVSALQAGLFSAYGALYQQVSAEAAAMYDVFVNTLGTSAGTYAATEAANASAANSPFSSLSSAAATPALGDIPDVLDIGIGNATSAMSNLVGLGNGGLLLPPEQGAAAAAEAAGVESAAGLSAAPVAVGSGGASSVSYVGALSAPPAWAGPATLVSNVGAPKLAGWTAVASQAPQTTTLLPGLPGMASTSRSSAGFGAPRYGVRPMVMTKSVAG
ncbi:PE family protein [Mycobacterium asiaticum]|uniref:PE family protein n=1 Tax=Mycobacterium asiaticum TaxID=1790 RepID=A0A1A3NHN2_MYCAS|nr:PE domain-containing protein [Mycobacterium asiaticum]OBK21658.1 PE family protein [Mycobacterium asiaticum]